MVARSEKADSISQDAVLVRRFGNVDVRARALDSYVDATALCKLAGREWYSYIKRKETKRFLQSLEARLRAKTPNDGLEIVQTSKGGDGGGKSWIHPQVVIHFIQWASPEFAVQVTEWVQELLTTGSVKISNPPLAPGADLSRIKDELREEMRAEMLATFAPMMAEVQALTAPVQHERMATIRSQCQHWGWYHPSDRQQTEIRNRAYELHLEKYGELPTKMLGRCLWVGEDQIELLNQAIVYIRNQYDRKMAQSGPHIPGTV